LFLDKFNPQFQGLDCLLRNLACELFHIPVRIQRLVSNRYAIRPSETHPSMT
jgi:hypothetical protein